MPDLPTDPVVAAINAGDRAAFDATLAHISQAPLRGGHLLRQLAGRGKIVA